MLRSAATLLSALSLLKRNLLRGLLSVASTVGLLILLLLFNETNWDSSLEEILKRNDKGVPLVLRKTLPNLHNEKLELSYHNLCYVFLYNSY